MGSRKIVSVLAALAMFLAFPALAEWKTQTGFTKKSKTRYGVVYSINYLERFEADDGYSEVAVDCYAGDPFVVTLRWILDDTKDPKFLTGRVSYKFTDEPTVRRKFEPKYHSDVGFRMRMPFGSRIASAFIASVLNREMLIVAAEKLDGKMLDSAFHFRDNFKEALAEACSWHPDYGKHVR